MTTLAPVLDGVVDEVLQHLHDLLALAADARGPVELSHGYRHLRCCCDRLERLGDISRHFVQFDDALGRKMDADLDPTERQQIVDQARHPCRLARHNGEKSLSRIRIVARWALQRLDKTAQ